ncbi:sensor histidine kinase [Nocardia jiangxiensis]|uniref:sensor histidine kinase n=1 Tax=Nocardia jiangxiensis TaxID=282685 RepID=UPI0005926FA2|nr:histidine kinase [Nocardia jiangxiensis]
MAQRLLRTARRLLGTDPENSPLFRIVGGLLLAANLLWNHRGPVPVWLWVVFGGAYAIFLIYEVFGDNRPRLVVPALIGCMMLSAVATVPWPDTNSVSAPVIQLWVTVGIFARQIAVSTRTILTAVAVAAVLLIIGDLLAGEFTTHVLTPVAILVIVLLMGLYRRQYRLQIHQTEMLLEQTRRAQQEHARAAALDERARIAREMHDVLAHSLGALTVQLEVAEGLLSEKGDVTAALTHLRRSHRLAQDGLTEARGAVAALREDVPPLPEAVRGLVEGYRRDRRMSVDCLVDGEPRAVQSAAVVSLLRTAREALTNAAKHAPGAAVTVALSFTPDRVRLSVRNPILSGTEPAEPPRARDENGGYGLTGMRERIALVGGTLSAGPGRDGRDWVVTAEVPG